MHKKGWSAPPEVFQEKSLLEIEEEKRKNVKHKKQAAPKQHDFPTLGKSGFHGRRPSLTEQYGKPPRIFNYRFPDCFPLSERRIRGCLPLGFIRAPD